MILYSGVLDVAGRLSSEATVEEADEPGVRNVFDSSDRRVSGLELGKGGFGRGVHSCELRSEEDDVARVCDVL
jgi:hypothetical protein